MRLPKFQLTVDGTEYEAELCQVEDFHLGVEDHGLFTAMVAFKGPGWGQGLPAMGLDEYDDLSKTRRGTAFGMDYLMELIRVIGSPELASGRQVVVLRRGHFIEGVAALKPNGETGEPFIPARLVSKHFPEGRAR